MDQFWFYIKLGLDHVLDFGAYDHILFLAALAIPFTFKGWKKVVILATIFTVAHCLSLALSTYDVLKVDVGLIEFLIPVTIFITAVFNLFYARRDLHNVGLYLHVLATAFFGLIHGFGFSNYFKMLMAEEDDKIGPLLGFATGIEISQVLIILCVLLLSYIMLKGLRLKQPIFIVITSLIVIGITIPMLIATFPW